MDNCTVFKMIVGNCSVDLYSFVCFFFFFLQFQVLNPSSKLYLFFTSNHFGKPKINVLISINKENISQATTKTGLAFQKYIYFASHPNCCALKKSSQNSV